jgi:hypothetical protein
LALQFPTQSTCFVAWKWWNLWPPTGVSIPGQRNWINSWPEV